MTAGDAVGEPDDGATLADRMRQHAGDSDHLYGHLTRSMADDWEAGGPVRRICRGWEDAPPDSVVQLRLLAGLFRIVLTDRAPQLAAYYPCLGGTAPPAQAWRQVRPVLADHAAELHQALTVAPQTNETGRAAALLVGLFDVVRRSGLRRVRLLEPGASAGLNLLVDEFRFVNPGWSFGPESSPLRLVDTVHGHVEPERFEIVERRGCDLSPVDPSTPDGRLRLRSFVWPFHLARHERLTHALAIAERRPPPVEAAPAGQWLEERLAEPTAEPVLTVVWQSITQQYWPVEESARVDDAIGTAARRMPLARVRMEYDGRDTAELSVAVSTDAGGLVAARRLGDVGDHGTPVSLSPAEGADAATT